MAVVIFSMLKSTTFPSLFTTRYIGNSFIPWGRYAPYCLCVRGLRHEKCATIPPDNACGTSGIYRTYSGLVKQKTQHLVFSEKLFFALLSTFRFSGSHPRMLMRILRGKPDVSEEARLFSLSFHKYSVRKVFGKCDQFFVILALFSSFRTFNPHRGVHRSGRIFCLSKASRTVLLSGLRVTLPR